MLKTKCRRTYERTNEGYHFRTKRKRVKKTRCNKYGRLPYLPRNRVECDSKLLGYVFASSIDFRRYLYGVPIMSIGKGSGSGKGAYSVAESLNELVSGEIAIVIGGGVR